MIINIIIIICCTVQDHCVIATTVRRRDATMYGVVVHRQSTVRRCEIFMNLISRTLVHN